MSSIAVCPSCKVRVVPTAEGVCPSCQSPWFGENPSGSELQTIERFNWAKAQKRHEKYDEQTPDWMSSLGCYILIRLTAAAVPLAYAAIESAMRK